MSIAEWMCDDLYGASEALCMGNPFGDDCEDAEEEDLMGDYDLGLTFGYTDDPYTAEDDAYLLDYWRVVKRET